MHLPHSGWVLSHFNFDAPQASQLDRSLGCPGVLWDSLGISGGERRLGRWVFFFGSSGVLGRVWGLILATFVRSVLCDTGSAVQTGGQGWGERAWIYTTAG